MKSRSYLNKKLHNNQDYCNILVVNEYPKSDCQISTCKRKHFKIVM